MSQLIFAVVAFVVVALKFVITTGPRVVNENSFDVVVLSPASVAVMML